MTDDSDDERRQINDLYREHAEKMRNYALPRTGGDLGLAQTAVQETFRAAWQNRATVLSYAPDRQAGWLFVTVRNKAINLSTRGARRFEESRDQTGLDLARPAVRSGAPLQAVLLQDVLAHCWDVIKEMPSVRRLVFARLADGWKTSEIADDLGITQSTVRDHIQAGRRQLNAKIGPNKEIFIDLEDENESGTER